MALDLSSLQKAVSSLERGISVANTMIKGAVDTDTEEVIRAGVIQNFEFTYELCWKFMKRWLEENATGEVIDGATMKELFRIAAERRLIKDVDAWFAYHKARNETSHIYDVKKAESVYAAAIRFAADAKDFLKVLEAKND